MAMQKDMMGRAVRDSFAKLDPRVQIQNPVMFLVWLSAVMTSVLAVASIFGVQDAGVPTYYVVAIAVILWLTDLFSNFAEALAEGRGKAQADSLRAAKKDVEAHRIESAEDKEHFTVVPGTELTRGDLVIVRAGEQIPGETHHEGDMIRVYVLEVHKMGRGPLIHVSRTHPNLVRRLFELETPEIADGQVEIRNIAREAGSRSKMAVRAAMEGIDPVGACVGPHGGRVGAVVKELGGEKIDIVVWSEDPCQYVRAALSPADVIDVSLIPGQKACRVIVPDDQLSLAIGKEGQNARLAARLTGYKIDIKPASQAEPAEETEEA